MPAEHLTPEEADLIDNVTEVERRARLRDELGVSDADLSSLIGSKRRDKRDRWLMRRTPETQRQTP